MSLATFTDTNLPKIKRGQYTFWNAADRQSTNRNLRVGGDSVSLGVAVGSGTATLNAALAGTFYITDAGLNYTVTVSNMVDGQMLRLVVIRGDDSGTITFSNATGVFVAHTGIGTDVFSFIKVGSTIYFVQSVLA